MTTSIKNFFNQSTPLEFQIGRGGRFSNGGHLSFVAADRRIDQTSTFNNLFLDEGAENNLNAEYRDESGNVVGLTVGEAQTGIGRIDIDGEYDTTYCTTIADLNNEELAAIVDDASKWEIREILAAREQYTILSILLAEHFDLFTSLIDGEDIEDMFSVSDEEPEDEETVEIENKYYTLIEE